MFRKWWDMRSSYSKDQRPRVLSHMLTTREPGIQNVKGPYGNSTVWELRDTGAGNKRVEG